MPTTVQLEKRVNHIETKLQDKIEALTLRTIQLETSDVVRNERHEALLTAINTVQVHFDTHHQHLEQKITKIFRFGWLMLTTSVTVVVGAFITILKSGV